MNSEYQEKKNIKSMKAVFFGGGSDKGTTRSGANRTLNHFPNFASQSSTLIQDAAVVSE